MQSKPIRMIPTHNSEETNNSRIVLNKLGSLNSYDFANPHRHGYFEFFCFLKGGGSHEIDFKTVSIQSNSMHIVAPGQVHQVKRSLDSEGFVFLFQLETLRAPAEVTDFLFDHICHDMDERTPEYHVPEDKQDWFRRTLNSVWEDFNGKSEFSALQVKTGIQQLVLKCMEWDQHLKTDYSNQYAEFRRKLFENFRTIKKVNEYASLLNISEKSLNDMVRSHTGKSASKVIYDQIVLEAKRLLLTGMPAKQTGYELGFEDPAHFSKFFKTQTGLSPSNFQNVHAEV